MNDTLKQKAPTIKCANMEDVNDIYEVIRTHPDELLVRSLSDIVQNIDRFYVAKYEGRVVGCASWGFLPEIGDMARTSVEIKSVAVDREWRSKGVGRQLVLAVMERLQPLQVAQYIVLTFTPDFFAKLGFREIPKKQIMHKIYMGCINCTKYSDPFTCPEVAMAFVPQHD